MLTCAACAEASENGQAAGGQAVGEQAAGGQAVGGLSHTWVMVSKQRKRYEKSGLVINDKGV